MAVTPVAVTVTAFVALTGCIGWVSTATVAVAPEASVPSLQVRVSELRVHVPWPGVAETNSALTGNLALYSTAEADAPPVFFTEVVNVACWSATIDVGLAV